MLAEFPQLPPRPAASAPAPIRPGKQKSPSLRAGLFLCLVVRRRLGSSSLPTAVSNGYEGMAIAAGLAQIPALDVSMTGRWQLGYAWLSPCCREADVGH
jgi:hypothetical protein